MRSLLSIFLSYFDFIILYFLNDFKRFQSPCLNFQNLEKSFKNLVEDKHKFLSKKDSSFHGANCLFIT